MVWRPCSLQPSPLPRSAPSQRFAPCALRPHAPPTPSVSAARPAPAVRRGPAASGQLASPSPCACARVRARGQQGVPRAITRRGARTPGVAGDGGGRASVHRKGLARTRVRLTRMPDLEPRPTRAFRPGHGRRARTRIGCIAGGGGAIGQAAGGPRFGPPVEVTRMPDLELRSGRATPGTPRAGEGRQGAGRAGGLRGGANGDGAGGRGEVEGPDARGRWGTRWWRHRMAPCRISIGCAGILDP